jgi:hypothetical protein
MEIQSRLARRADTPAEQLLLESDAPMVPRASAEAGRPIPRESPRALPVSSAPGLARRRQCLFAFADRGSRLRWRRGVPSMHSLRRRARGPRGTRVANQPQSFRGRSPSRAFLGRGPGLSRACTVGGRLGVVDGVSHSAARLPIPSPAFRPCIGTAVGGPSRLTVRNVHRERSFPCRRRLRTRSFRVGENL